MSAQIVARLRALLPDLEWGRETHVQWRDYLASGRAPSGADRDVGDAAFHQRLVEIYDERIAAVCQAADFIAEQGRAA